ncbi:putative ribonuclease H [Stachybotrys elegans]|uniref:Ribonuclease H n=1 Tax=Stachybotrys elegans TaxID=80388 RepID=A0A8K0WS64_9HYPO|nr:putative ribonuclease H [Stachybotrys elegans]
MSKRSADAMPSASKKRKTDKGPKFYAVRCGWQPGVYDSYDKCSTQTTGFKGAIFKSFTSRKDAEDFVAGKKVETPSDEPTRYYAVAVGRSTGIFTDWAEAEPHIKGASKPKYKKFNSYAEAVEFIKENGDRDAVEALGETFDPSPPPPPPALALPVQVEAPSKRARVSRGGKAEPGTVPRSDILQVWTDGSSRANGRKDASAGIGVYFGPNDPRNLAERLEGEAQTNQRAELTAMLRAMEMVPNEQSMMIWSDSRYSINCVNTWAETWETKEWKTATGGEVKNKDIIVKIRAKVKERGKAGAVTLLEWVKGHGMNVGNNAADRLANEGALKSLPITFDTNDTNDTSQASSQSSTNGGF